MLQNRAQQDATSLKGSLWYWHEHSRSNRDAAFWDPATLAQGNRASSLVSPLPQSAILSRLRQYWINTGEDAHRWCLFTWSEQFRTERVTYKRIIVGGIYQKGHDFPGLSVDYPQRQDTFRTGLLAAFLDLSVDQAPIPQEIVQAMVPKLVQSFECNILRHKNL